MTASAARRAATLDRFASHVFDLLIVGGGATRRGDRARRGPARAGRRAVRRGRLRRRDLQPVVEADPRRPALPAVRQPAPGLRRADRTAPPDADGAPPVPADRVRVSRVPRREPAPGHAGRRHRDLQRARALAPARARPQAVRPRALRAGAAPARRRPRRARWPTSTARPTTPASCSRTSSTPRPPARPSPTTCAPRPRCAIAAAASPASRSRTARPAQRFEARARVVLSATGPFTDSFLAEPARHRLRPTLGVHLVFDAARVPHGGRALVLRSPARQPAVLRPARRRAHHRRHDRHRLVVAASRRASTTTSARAAKTSPTCSRRPTTRFPTCAWRRTTCCRPSRPCGRCSRPAPTRRRRPRASTRSRAPRTACWSIAGGKLTTLRRMGEAGRRPLDRGAARRRPRTRARSLRDRRSPAAGRRPAARVAGGRRACRPT